MCVCVCVCDKKIRENFHGKSEIRLPANMLSLCRLVLKYLLSIDPIRGESLSFSICEFWAEHELT